MYNIRTSIHGGTTGARTSLVKDGRTGEPKVFSNIKAAQGFIDAMLMPTRLKGGFTPSGRPIPEQFFDIVPAVLCTRR